MPHYEVLSSPSPSHKNHSGTSSPLWKTMIFGKWKSTLYPGKARALAWSLTSNGQHPNGISLCCRGASGMGTGMELEMGMVFINSKKRLNDLERSGPMHTTKPLGFNSADMHSSSARWYCSKKRLWYDEKRWWWWWWWWWRWRSPPISNNNSVKLFQVLVCVRIIPL